MTSGSEKRKRDTHLTIRLTPEERAQIEAASEAASLTPGSYARNVLLGAPAPRQVRRPPVERRELARLLGELGKIGSNLNQLAKESNQGEPPYKREVLAVLGLLVRVCDAILIALGRSP
jgi:hypothetical protein